MTQPQQDRAASTEDQAPEPLAKQPGFQAAAHSLAVLHTALSIAAFGSALTIGLYLHHQKIVKNEFYGWPDEFFPSVSATIGDHFPERNTFQLLIALTSGPRFLLILVAYLAHLSLRPASNLPGIAATVSVLRTLACGGWVFVTSSDHGDVHDVFMISYIALNLPYMVLTTLLTPPSSPAKSPRRWLGSTFVATLVPLVSCYLQHKVHRVAGAYSVYALLEWSLIVLDVSFDSLYILDFPPNSPSSTALSLFVSRTPAPAAVDVPVNASSYLARLSRTVAKLEMATSGTRKFVAEAYLSFAFWTLLVGLGPMIFYESVWSMGLSGWEVLLLCTLTPFLLCLPTPLLSLFSHPAAGNIGLLVGLAARYSENEEGDGMRRLKFTAGGLGLATMGLVSGWWRVRGAREKVEGKASTFLTGLLLSVLIKFSNHSLNPLWPFLRSHSTNDPKFDNGGRNGVGLILAVFAYIDLAIRRTPTTAQSTQRHSTSLAAKAAAIIGFGSLFFLLHFLYTDAGTTIAWTFTGYPHSGPAAFPGGLLTLLFLSLGLVAPSFVPETRITSRNTFTLACTATTLLYSCDGWVGYLPGALLGSYAFALFPSLLRSLLLHSPGRSVGLTAGLSFLLYALLELASTWTVAYAFVPAGWVLRERTDVVLALALGGIGLGLLPVSSSLPSTPAPLPPSRSRALRRRLSSAVVFVLLAALLVVVYRSNGGGVWEGAVDGPYHSTERIVTAGIWTVHFGLDGRLWESQRRMAHLFLDAEIDVIGLLETDVHRIVGGNRDLTQYISHALKMPYVDLGPGPHKNTWGAALISKFPILRSTHHLLPSPSGELAPAIFATLDVYGVELDVVVAHNGQEEDPVDRQLQSMELGRLMRESWPKPTLFLGYLVTTPHAERPAPYKYIFEDGRIFDVQPNDLERWCQYLGYRGVHRVGYARLQRGSNPSVTDSEIQLMKVVVPVPNATSTSSPYRLSLSDPSSPEYVSSTSDDYKDDGHLDNDAAKSRPTANLTSLPPIPLSSYAAHLALTSAPVPPLSPSSTDDDGTFWAPERYLPPSLLFPTAKFADQGSRGHFYIVLNGQTGAAGQNAFMEKEEKERRRLREVEELDKFREGEGGEGCPIM